MKFVLGMAVFGAIVGYAIAVPSLLDAYGPCRDMAIWDERPWVPRRCPRGAIGHVIDGQILVCECPL